MVDIRSQVKEETCFQTKALLLMLKQRSAYQTFELKDGRMYTNSSCISWDPTTRLNRLYQSSPGH